MKKVSFAETELFQVTSGCKVFEYGGNDSIDGAVAEINGRYPAKGWALNILCSEMIFTLAGEGSLVTENAEYVLAKDTTILIDPNERYYFKGSHLRVFLATTPPWTAEQHKNIT